MSSILEDRVRLRVLDDNNLKKEIEILYKDINNLPKLDCLEAKNKFIQGFVIPEKGSIFFTITAINEKDVYYGEENISGPYRL